MSLKKLHRNKALCVAVFLTAGLLNAQPVVAPSPDQAGRAEGQDTGRYNITNSFEFGYRFASVDGDSSLFHNTEDYRNGLRMFGTGFTANSKDGHGTLFDSLSLTSSGMTNDPYAAATLRAEKNGAYRYDFNIRKSDYDNLPLDNGASANLMRTRRVLQDHDLTVPLARWLKLQAGYSRMHQTGDQDSTYEAYIGGLARSVLPLLQNVRRDYNEYRSGAQLDFLGFRLTVSHQWELFKDDTTTEPLVPGHPYSLRYVVPYQPALPVTYPSLVTAYSRSNPVHGLTRSSFVNLNRSTRLWTVNARVVYTKADQTSSYLETESGARAVANSVCSNCGAGAPTDAFTNMPGSSRRPFSSADLTFSVVPSRRLTIVNSASAQNYHQDGVGQMIQINNVAANKNLVWDYRIGDKRISDALEADYRVTEWLGLKAEYRYTARWLENNLIRYGTTKSADLNRLANHLNVGTFGVRIRPVKALTFDADGGVGKDNSPLTPVAPADFHNVRARAEYRRSRRTRFETTYRQAYNVNAPAPVVFTSAYGTPPPSYFSSRSRDLSATYSVAVNSKWSLDASYNKIHLDTFANLWTEQPAPNSTTIVSVPGNYSRYISNIHSASLMARAALGRRVILYAGYSLTKDVGDGRSVQNLGLTDPAASFLAGFNTFPVTYQSPLARVSVNVTPKLHWNGGWQLYGYNQQFAYFGYDPYYRAHTGYTSISFAF